MHPKQQQRVGRQDRPPCFPSDEHWVAWCVHEAMRPIHNGNGYCYDCTKEYHARMTAIGRCEHVLTVFVRTRHPNERVGRRPIASRRATTSDKP